MLTRPALPTGTEPSTSGRQFGDAEGPVVSTIEVHFEAVDAAALT